MFNRIQKFNCQQPGRLLVFVAAVVTMLIVIQVGMGLAKAVAPAKAAAPANPQAEDSQSGAEESQSSDGTSGSSESGGPLKVVVNDKETFSDVPVIIRAGRLFLPVRFVAESLDLPVEWVESTSTVYIGARPTGTDLVRELPVPNAIKIKNAARIKGVGYPTGYLLEGNLYQNLIWNLNNNYQYITFGAGVLDKSKSQSAGFQVIGDERSLGKATLTKDDGLKEFSYNVKGVKVLTITSYGGAGGAIINPRAQKVAKK